MQRATSDRARLCRVLTAGIAATVLLAGTSGGAAAPPASLVPARLAAVVDFSARSGRNAAAQGHRVVAIEPTPELSRPGERIARARASGGSTTRCPHWPRCSD
ncbi:hypothetical protein MOV08_00600 [Streptomyces yunnanensis]|uniref:Uncharacterized protein n=1 Tax=Streptomyces yunnanensis TaxID=156453 RepID=A0ABY7ZZ41_9ACTN|nr:hypothetical protein [Streptomyces yunnanensis]WEB37960.1 hypothetical protein MOV08_00600 [Streptomyces yunnanensis]